MGQTRTEPHMWHIGHIIWVKINYTEYIYKKEGRFAIQQIQVPKIEDLYHPVDLTVWIMLLLLIQN